MLDEFGLQAENILHLHIHLHEGKVHLLPLLIIYGIIPSKSPIYYAQT